jgi:hypothetical protein
VIRRVYDRETTSVLGTASAELTAAVSLAGPTGIVYAYAPNGDRVWYPLDARDVHHVRANGHDARAVWVDA